MLKSEINVIGFGNQKHKKTGKNLITLGFFGICGGLVAIAKGINVWGNKEDWFEAVTDNGENVVQELYQTFKDIIK